MLSCGHERLTNQVICEANETQSQEVFEQFCFLLASRNRLMERRAPSLLGNNFEKYQPAAVSVCP